MKRKGLVFALLTVALTLPASAARYQVIVNESNPAGAIDKTTVQDYYLGKATRWSDGTTVAAVDLEESSAVRADFSKEVLRKPVANVKSYWLTIIFSGRGVPPPALASDEKVIEAVRKNKGAIGYVSATATLPAGVKAIRVE